MASPARNNDGICSSFAAVATTSNPVDSASFRRNFTKPDRRRFHLAWNKPQIVHKMPSLAECCAHMAQQKHCSPLVNLSPLLQIPRPMTDLTDTDYTQRFIFDDSDTRGELVTLERSYAEVLAKHTYPEPVKQLLGELMAAASLLVGTLRSEE